MLEEDTQNDPGICCKNSERTCACCFSKSMMLQEKYLDATKRFSKRFLCDVQSIKRQFNFGFFSYIYVFLMQAVIFCAHWSTCRSQEHVPHCLEDPDFVAILKEVRNEPTLDSDAAASDIKAFSFQSDKEDVAKKRLADFAKTNAPSNVGIQTKLHFSMQVRTPTSSPKSSHTFCSPDSHKEKDGRDEDFSEDSQAKDRRELETKDEKQPKDLGF